MRTRPHGREGRSAGFTLVELMVAMTMGLIVSLAAVGLARTATTTFHEQARLSGVEMTLRTASERLRSDLAKVSYMSTSNIMLDPRLARRPGDDMTTLYRTPELQNLQGIRIEVGAGKGPTQGSNNLATRHSLNPDVLHVAGNLTSDDSYRGQWIANGSCSGLGAQLRLNAVADPAVSRLFNGATTPAQRVAAATAVFMPGLAMNPPVASMTYAAQVMDPRGCFQYVRVCSIDAANDATSVLVSIGGAPSAILTPADTGGATCGGRMMEEFAIAPIQRVKWSLGASTDLRLFDPVLEGAGTEKFNLQRQLMDISDTTPIGPPELVAEYAIDMKFGLVVDDVRNPTATRFRSFDMDTGGADVALWTAVASGTKSGLEGPQRIRSVRYRLAFRAPVADRNANLPLPAGPPYLARYCTGPDPCKQYYRVRTVMSEVALVNQARLTMDPASAGGAVPY